MINWRALNFLGFEVDSQNIVANPFAIRKADRNAAVDPGLAEEEVSHKKGTRVSCGKAGLCQSGSEVRKNFPTPNV